MPIQPYGFVLAASNLALTLALFLLLPLLLDFDAVIELLLAAEVAMLGAAEFLLARQFDSYKRKIFIGLGESLKKLLLISFFWSSIKRADFKRSLKLVCFSASSGAEIDNFKVSLNFSTR